MFGSIREQIDTIFQRDPAAKGVLEVLLLYPGLHVMVLHRLSHKLWTGGCPFLPRLISHLGRWITGIEIHPGARIGRRFFIDHGMGVVIGETTEIGDDVLIYQGVTLGGTGNEKGKRHPTIGSHVVIGAGAKILGGIEIGDHARIGAGSVVVRPVPPHSTVVGIPGRVVRSREEIETDALEHGRLPDVEAQEIEALKLRMRELEQMVHTLAQERELERR